MTRRQLISAVPIILALLTTSCFSGKKIKQEDSPYKTSRIYIKALDLSEDRNAFSSGNDEIMHFIYGDSANNKHVLLYNTYHIVTKTPDTVSYTIKAVDNKYKSYTMVLIEIDENNVIDQVISDSIRNNIKRLEKAFVSKDLESISNIIEDNDLLGIQRVTGTDLFLKKGSVEFKGTHLFDKYNYKISWE